MTDIFTKYKSILDIPWYFVSDSEGDINLYFDELIEPLYLLYKELNINKYKWFINRSNIRKQCMIHRMFWKKYNKMLLLQNKMNEMKKREHKSLKYTIQLKNDMNDIINKKKFDKYKMQIYKKKSLINTKYNSLKEKKKYY
eukprot:89517_1